jgi:hypothetical protein
LGLLRTLFVASHVYEPRHQPNYQSNGSRPFGEGASDGEGGSLRKSHPTWVRRTSRNSGRRESRFVTARDGLVTAGADAGAHTFNNIQMPTDFRWSIRDLICSISSFRNSSCIVSNIFCQIRDRSDAIELQIRSLNPSEWQVVQSSFVTHWIIADQRL